MKKQIIILKVASEAIQHELATSEANAKKMDYHRALNSWRKKNGYHRHKFDGNASCNDKIKADGRWDEMLESADAEYAEWIKARVSATTQSAGFQQRFVLQSALA